jgi:uncharacterized protein YutE (UPF0331/DUF86 family)
MPVEKAVRAQLQQLISDATALIPGKGDGNIRNQEHRSECVGWLASASHIANLICKDPTNPYRQKILMISISREADGVLVNRSVGQVTEILKRLSRDVENGLVASITIAASAETLDDLLDQASDYHTRKNKVGAGILATAVFEDTMRRLARINEVAEIDVKADRIISNLDSKGIITGIMAKRCRVAAGVRNRALHAQWDEFSLTDVEDVIRLTRELLSGYFAG